MTFKNQYGAIWWCNDHYMAYLNVPELNAKVSSWKNSMLVAEYYYPNGKVRKQFIIPGDKLETVIELLKIDDQIGIF